MRYDAPAGIRTINGTSGPDTVQGSAGSDRTTGGKGNDYLLGNDYRFGNHPPDEFVFSSGDGFDKVGDFQPGSGHLVFKAISSSHVTYKAAAYSGQTGVDVLYTAKDHVFLVSVSIVQPDFWKF
jgi:Ca2+-binding RTX toxin-like protein